jgi:hypothetical protein
VAIACVACAAIVGLEDEQPYPDEGGADGPAGDDGGDADAHPADDADSAVEASGELVASEDGGPVGVAVDNTYVYWTEEKLGTVWRRDKTLDGGPELVASNQDAPRHLLVDSTYLYWNNFDKPVRMSGGNPVAVPIVVRVNRSDPLPPTTQTLYADVSGHNYARIALYPGPTGPTDDTLFAVSPSTVQRFNRATTVAAPTACGPTGTFVSPSAVTADVDFVWWVDTQQTYRRLKSFTTAAAPPNLQKYGQPLPEIVVDMAVDGDFLYYTTVAGNVLDVAHGPSFDGGLGTDAAALDAGPNPVDAGPANKLGAVAPTPAALAVRGGVVYLTRWSAGSDGEVVMIPSDGGMPVTLATGQRDPRDLAIDTNGGTTTLYWASYVEGTIRRVTVP